MKNLATIFIKRLENNENFCVPASSAAVSRNNVSE